MRKFISSSPGVTLFLILFICIASLVVINSCRKFDHNENNHTIDNTERFLALPPNVNPAIKKVADKIRKMNQQSGFLNEFISKQGFAIWNKSVITPSHNQSSSARINGGEDDAYCLLIPLVLDGGVQVHGAIACKVASDSVYFTLMDGSAYKTFTADSASRGMNGRQLSLTLMYLDKLVFGHRVFKITDSAAFPGKQPVEVNLDSAAFIPSSGRMAIYTITICYNDWIPPHDGQVVGCPPGDDNCNGYVPIHYCESYSIFGDDDYGDGDPPPPPTGGGEGAGGGGGGTGDTPCKMFPGTEDGCGTGGSPGWVPMDDVDDFLTDYLNQGYHHFETWEVSAEDYGKIQEWRQHNIDTTGLDSCTKEILNKLLSNNNNLLGKILAKMERAGFSSNNIENFKITFLVGPLPGMEKGETLPGHYSSGVFKDTIILKDSLVSKGTQLGVAKTLIHELMHAYLKSILYRTLNLTPAQMEAMLFDSIFSNYIDTLISVQKRHGLQSWVTNNPQWDHNFMADMALQRMVDALAFIDDNRNTDEYYWDVTWGGLWLSKTMKYYWPNANLPSPDDWPPGNPAPNNDSTWGLKYAFTQERLDSIRNYVYREQNGSPLAKGRKKITGGCY